MMTSSLIGQNESIPIGSQMESSQDIEPDENSLQLQEESTSSMEDYVVIDEESLEIAVSLPLIDTKESAPSSIDMVNDFPKEMHPDPLLSWRLSEDQALLQLEKTPNLTTPSLMEEQFETQGEEEDSTILVVDTLVTQGNISVSEQTLNLPERVHEADVLFAAALGEGDDILASMVKQNTVESDIRAIQGIPIFKEKETPEEFSSTVSNSKDEISFCQTNEGDAHEIPSLENKLENLPEELISTKKADTLEESLPEKTSREEISAVQSSQCDILETPLLESKIKEEISLIPTNKVIHGAEIPLTHSKELETPKESLVEIVPPVEMSLSPANYSVFEKEVSLPLPIQEEVSSHVQESIATTTCQENFSPTMELTASIEDAVGSDITQSSFKDNQDSIDNASLAVNDTSSEENGIVSDVVEESTETFNDTPSTESVEHELPMEIPPPMFTIVDSSVSNGQPAVEPSLTKDIGKLSTPDVVPNFDVDAFVQEIIQEALSGAVAVEINPEVETSELPSHVETHLEMSEEQQACEVEVKKVSQIDMKHCLSEGTVDSTPQLSATLDLDDALSEKVLSILDEEISAEVSAIPPQSFALTDDKSVVESLTISPTDEIPGPQVHLESEIVEIVSSGISGTADPAHMVNLRSSSVETLFEAELIRCNAFSEIKRASVEEEEANATEEVIHSQVPESRNVPATIAEEIFDSIITPGLSGRVLSMMHASFFALILTLVVLLVLTHSMHAIFLLAVNGALWGAITLFISDINAQKEIAQEHQDATDCKKSQ